MRGKIMSGALIGLSLLILVGVALTTWFMLRPAEQENFLNLNLDNGSSESVEFRDLNMYPGKTVSYTMFLFSEIDDDYTVDFDFREMEGEILKEYINVTVTVDDEVFIEDTLKNLLDGSGKALDCYLQDGIPCTVHIDFAMPEDVGNAPMGTKTLFELVLTASNE